MKSKQFEIVLVYFVKRFNLIVIQNAEVFVDQLLLQKSFVIPILPSGKVKELI